MHNSNNLQTVGAFEAKTHLSALLDQVEKGAQIVITKHGHPIAKIVPIGKGDRVKIHQAVERLKVFGKKNKLAGIDWKDLVSEGRK
jgi:prevent-host-death family protein